MYISVYIGCVEVAYVCVFVSLRIWMCVCVWERERERERADVFFFFFFFAVLLGITSLSVANVKSISNRQLNCSLPKPVDSWTISERKAQVARIYLFKIQTSEAVQSAAPTTRIKDVNSLKDHNTSWHFFLFQKSLILCSGDVFEMNKYEYNDLNE